MLLHNQVSGDQLSSDDSENGGEGDGSIPESPGNSWALTFLVSIASEAEEGEETRVAHPDSRFRSKILILMAHRKAKLHYWLLTSLAVK